MPAEPTRSSSPAVFADSQDVDPAWTPPAPPEHQPTRVRHRHKALLIGAPILSAVLIIALVWIFGGFDRRTDRLIPAKPGDLIATGPYEFTFSAATVQHKRDFDDSLYWEVSVSGQARNTGTVAIKPNTVSNPMFVAHDEVSDQVQEPHSDRIGEDTSSLKASTLTPGLPLVPYQVTFRFTDPYQPSTRITFGISKLEFTDNLLIKSGEKTWNNTGYLFTIDLPLTALPEDIS